MLRPQTCKKCGRIQYVVWHVSDEIWAEFCERTGWDESKTICLECFAEHYGFVDLDDISKNVRKEKLW